MDALCPVCQKAMTEVSGHFHCETCHGNYQQQAECPDCAQPLQVLKACGAVDYFAKTDMG